MYANQKTGLNPRIEMPEEEYSKLIELLYVQANSENEKMIYFYLREWLNKRYITNYTDETGNLVAVKGQGTKPCIVSHMDTVHKIHKEFDIFESIGDDGNKIVSAYSGKHQVGVGGDDKCGIYACLYMLEHFDDIKVIFFTREEVGLIGSSNIDHDEFDDCGYIIQLDRWGSSDFICNYSNDKTVSDKYISKISGTLHNYSYNQTSGLITDSINLFNDSIGISCVNVSCGYYSHHSNSEIIDVNELWHSVLFTEQIIKDLGRNSYPMLPPVVERYKPAETKSLHDSYYWSGNNNSNFDYDIDDESWELVEKIELYESLVEEESQKKDPDYYLIEYYEMVVENLYRYGEIDPTDATIEMYN